MNDVMANLGMLAFGDGLLAISNSGETTEVVAVARYCRDHEIPVIVITSRELCELGELARKGDGGGVRVLKIIEIVDRRESP